MALDLDFTEEFVSLKQGLWLLGRKGHPGCVTTHSKPACPGMRARLKEGKQDVLSLDFRLCIVGSARGCLS